MTTTTTTRYVSAKDTAVLIRKALKRRFPGVKFSVRTDTYSAGASIRVRYTDGPMLAEVEPVARAFQGAGFDGMIDLKYHHAHYLTPDGDVVLASTYGHGMGLDGPSGNEPPPGSELVHLGADHVFVDRDLSPEYTALLKSIGQVVLKRAVGWQDRSMDDPFWPYEGIPTEWGVLPVGGPDALIRVLSLHIRPDGTEVER